jgi:hypothetical protein
MKWYAGSAEEDETRTGDLEDEELSGAVDDSDDEEEKEDSTPGSVLYSTLRDYDLVNGTWAKLLDSEKEQYEAAAGDLDISA